jgi:hypothetical protein
MPLSNTARNILIALLIILIGGAAFALGKISRIFEARKPIEILYDTTLQNATTTPIVAEPPLGEKATTTVQKPAPKATGKYVGARTGTKYYLPSCSGANRIKEENKVWFATAEEAESRGYTPAANCEGI